METAKVDINRLQLLNDRINQTIDALCQVRLSVRGLEHASPVASTFGLPISQAPAAYPMLPGIAQNPFIAAAAGCSPMQMAAACSPMQMAAACSPLPMQSTYPFATFGGLGHTSAASPATAAYLQQLAAACCGLNPAACAPVACAPVGMSPIVGLSHSSPIQAGCPTPTSVDPFWTSRIAQTFPFAFCCA